MWAIKLLNLRDLHQRVSILSPIRRISDEGTSVHGVPWSPSRSDTAARGGLRSSTQGFRPGQGANVIGDKEDPAP